MEYTRRQSDRVNLAIPIEVIGSDALGAQFFQIAETSVLSRRGATIVLNRKLVPEQEITIRCIKSARESDARVVGMTGQLGADFVYGVALLNAPVDFWDVQFPALSEDDQAIRVLLSCNGCGRHEISLLDEVELQVLDTNASLQRYCKACLMITRWYTESTHDLVSSPPPLQEASPKSEISAPSKPARRKHNRVSTNLEACVRQWSTKSEVVLCEDISKGGLRFLGPTRYEKDTRLEIAVPCSPGGAGNIFVSARIMYVHPVGDRFRHGARFSPDMR